MDINQTATHLQRLGQPFDVVISSNGIERTLYKNLEPTDVKSLLEEVIEGHSPDQLIIQEKRRNGATNVKEGKFNVDLKSLYGLNETPVMQQNISAPTQGLPNDYKDYLISDLKEKNGKLETRLSKIEDENEKLKRENFELEKENKYKDKEFELERKSQEFEKSNGLSGIMETVSTNPVLANVAATALTRLMGVDAPQQQIEGVNGTETPADTIQAKVAHNITEWLKDTDEQTAQRFYQMATLVAQDPTQIETIINLLTDNE